MRVANRKKLVDFPKKGKDKDAMLQLVMGRSGNLRAPTIKVGDTYFVGFSADGYSELFGVGG